MDLLKDWLEKMFNYSLWDKSFLTTKESMLAVLKAEDTVKRVKEKAPIMSVYAELWSIQDLDELMNNEEEVELNKNIDEKKQIILRKYFWAEAENVSGIDRDMLRVSGEKIFWVFLDKDQKRKIFYSWVDGKLMLLNDIKWQDYEVSDVNALIRNYSISWCNFPVLVNWENSILYVNTSKPANIIAELNPTQYDTETKGYEEQTYEKKLIEHFGHLVDVVSNEAKDSGLEYSSTKLPNLRLRDDNRKETALGSSSWGEFEEWDEVVEYESFDMKWLSKKTFLERLLTSKRVQICNSKSDSLSGVIWDLTKLRDLMLYSNDFSTLPREVGNLESLKKITIISSKLQYLPKEICNLKNLKKLDVNVSCLNSPRNPREKDQIFRFVQKIEEKKWGYIEFSKKSNFYLEYQGRKNKISKEENRKRS